MTNVEIDLPSSWTERSDETQHGSALVEYQHETGDKTMFIVSVLPRTADDKGYKLYLSTINPTSIHVRHDYPIEDYDSLEDAVDGAESFIEQVSHRLQDGSISSADPTIEEIRTTIQAFTDDQLFPSFRCLLRRFR